jgi:hypothetical protein
MYTNRLVTKTEMSVLGKHITFTDNRKKGEERKLINILTTYVLSGGKSPLNQFLCNF